MVFGYGGGKITKRMLLAMFIIFSMTLLSLNDISAAIEIGNNSTQNGNITNVTNNTNFNSNNTTNSENNTTDINSGNNTTDINSGNNTTSINSNNNTDNIQNTANVANDSNYTNVTGIWLRSNDITNLNLTALINASITDIFVKINLTNYKTVLSTILNKTISTGIRINAWITCFKDANGNWIDPQGRYSYRVKVPYTVAVKLAHTVWYESWYESWYKSWYKSWYTYNGEWKYTWKYTWKHTWKHRWKHKLVYTTKHITKYKNVTKYGYSNTYINSLISFISNVTKTTYNINGTNYTINGIHLDYVRYPGTAYKYTNGTGAITSFVQKVYTTVKSINPSVAVSAALMPEGTVNAYYYGQNYTQLSNYLDFLVPMIYKGNYNKDTSWIGSTTKWIVEHSNGKPVVAGLQAYESDSNVTPIPASELQNDINAAISNGSSGYALFRYGLINSTFMATGSIIGQNIVGQSSNITTFTLTQIQDAAARVKSYTETYHKLPNYVQISTSQVTMPQFLQMLVTGLLQIKNGINTPIPLENINAPGNSTGNYMYGNINSTEYSNIAQKIKNFIGSNNIAPNYMTSSLGNIQYESLIYIYSKILNFYKANKRLPSYVIVDSSITNTNISSGLLKYLQATANCQVNDPRIKSLAASLIKGKSSSYSKAVAIFNWVRDKLGYSFYYNTKYGAVGALQKMTGNCVDTAHLVIALERAAGLPARYEHGYVQFSSGNWYGHVWAQVWVNGKWYYADGTSTRNSFGVINNWNTNTGIIKGIYTSLPF